MTMPMHGTYEMNPDIAEALAGIDERLPGYEAAREYDEVDVWSAHAAVGDSEVIRQADIEFDPNLVSVVVDAVANRLEIVSVTAVPAGQTDGTRAVPDAANPADAATATVNSIWDLNQLGLYIPAWHRRALRDGDAYLMAWPVDEVTTAEQETAAADGEDTTVQDVPNHPTSINITYSDPRLARLFYDPENPRIKRFFAHRWATVMPGAPGERPRECVRLNLIYPDRIEKYVSTHGNGAKASDFEPWVSDMELDAHDEALTVYADAGGDPGDGGGPVYPWPVPNPYGEIPVYHLRTDVEYGKPEARNAFALQDALSKLVEMLMVTVQFQGYPQAYALQGADQLASQTLGTDPMESGVDFGDPDSFDLDSLGDSQSALSKVVFSPGHIALLKGFRAIGQFTPADPNVFLEPWREFAKAVAATTDTPAYRFQGFTQPPSGESLKIVDAPLNKKVINRARLFGTAEREMFEFCLRALGMPGFRVTIAWANPSALDLAEVWDLVAKKVELGIPAKDALMAAGVSEPDAGSWAAGVDAAAALRREVLASRGRDRAVSG